MRASSLSYNTVAVNREIDSIYDAILDVRENLVSIATVAGLDVNALVAEMQEAKDFTGITVVSGSVANWDSVNKILTVPTLKGDQGTQGLKGDAGLTVVGPKGADGQKGDRGIQGLKGDKGDTGGAGSQGIQGIKGDRGSDLTVEQIGYNGNGTFTWQFSDGTSFTTPNLIGPQGLQGSKGDKGDTGTSVHHTKGTSTTDSEGNFGAPGEKDTYTMYGDAAETINLGWFIVTNGGSAYSYAVAAGYTGTESEYYNLLISSSTMLDTLSDISDEVTVASTQVAADRVIVEGAKNTATTSASSASSSATAASVSAASASSNATIATTKAGEANTSATNAAISATTATTSVTTATTKANDAAASATTAVNAVNSIGTSVTNAATSATSAANSATSASSSATTATTKASEASTSAASAAASATTATTKASTASTSASTASTKASEASTSAASALTSKNAASTSASEALTSKNAAAASATTATAAKDAAELALDQFTDLYLGIKTIDPIVDNDGEALQAGAIYYKSGTGLRIYESGAWNPAAFNTSGAVTSFNTRTGAISLSNADVTSAVGKDLSTVEVGATADQTGAEIKALYEAQTGKILDSVTRVGLNGTSDIGRLVWDAEEQTAGLKLNSNVTLQLGQEELVLVKNSTGATIANGKVVMVVGSNGNSGNLLVALHDGAKASAVPTLGITTQDIANGASGFVTKSGKVRGINTSGSAVGEIWVDGDVLYVTAGGNLTKVVPGETALKMAIAVVINSHATNGTLFVRTNGLDENHDKDWVNAKFAVVEW